ncbi:MAG: threonine-phosphate decarboxylase, partial [Clostridia bacterium]|nr:threonine-phosphate decarboxylase [Clostridia bacterium]
MLLNRKNPHGGDIYANRAILDFSANINPLGMPEAVKEALIRAAGHADVYPDPRCGALRERIAQAEGVPMDGILCGNGAAELIYLYA